MAAVGEAEASNAGEQLARNSLPETHPDDEPGAAGSAAPVSCSLGSHIGRVDLLMPWKTQPRGRRDFSCH